MILKRYLDCLLYKKKETNCDLFIVNTWLHYVYLYELGASLVIKVQKWPTSIILVCVSYVLSSQMYLSNLWHWSSFQNPPFSSIQFSSWALLLGLPGDHVFNVNNSPEDNQRHSPSTCISLPPVQYSTEKQLFHILEKRTPLQLLQAHYVLFKKWNLFGCYRPRDLIHTHPNSYLYSILR
mgnify:CR=1 FL=1